MTARLFEWRDITALVAMHALMMRAYDRAECGGEVPQADGHLAKRAYQIADAMSVAAGQRPRRKKQEER